MRNATFATFLAGIGISFSLLVPRAAEACWTCTTDNECPQGFTCEGSTGCMPTVDCKADSDCGAGMRCVTETATECAGDNSTCHPINSCAPIWQAGCSTDADCGSGFSCVENGSECNSSGCQALAQCQAKEATPQCNTDSDCPSCWSCLDSADTGEACVNPGGPASTTTNPGGPIAVDAGVANGDSSSSSPPVVASIGNVCRPPYWGLSVSYEGSAPANSTANGDLCPSIEATRSGFSRLDPKSSGSGSSGGCSIGSPSTSNNGAPFWILATAFAGLVAVSRRRRAAQS